MNLWRAIQWAWRTAMSRWWADNHRTQMAPVPAYTDLVEVVIGRDRLAAAYKADPWDGLLDYSSDPREVQYHLNRDSLGKLVALDCDDVAFWCAAALRGLGSAWVVILWDGSPNRLSHAVCEFVLRDGRRGVLDTSGLTWLAANESLARRFEQSDKWPKARFESPNGDRVPYPFDDPWRV